MDKCLTNTPKLSLGGIKARRTYLLAQIHHKKEQCLALLYIYQLSFLETNKIASFMYTSKYYWFNDKQSITVIYKKYQI